MDKNRLNTYFNFIDALLRCPKGQEWLLIQQHEDLIDRELLVVMEQAADRLNAEGSLPAAQFLQDWAMQL